LKFLVLLLPFLELSERRLRGIGQRGLSARSKGVLLLVELDESVPQTLWALNEINSRFRCQIDAELPRKCIEVNRGLRSSDRRAFGDRALDTAKKW